MTLRLGALGHQRSGRRKEEEREQEPKRHQRRGLRLRLYSGSVRIVSACFTMHAEFWKRAPRFEGRFGISVLRQVLTRLVPWFQTAAT